MLLRETYTVTECHQLLGIGRNLTYQAIRNGQIKAIRLGKRLVVPKREIQRLLNGIDSHPAEKGNKENG